MLLSILTRTTPPWKPAGPLSHIGTTDLADRGPEPHQGLGVSVSEHPAEWEEIAKLGGNPWWLIERPDAAFLDMRALTEPERASIMAWGVQEGLCQSVELHTVCYTDTEAGDRRFCSYQSAQEAKEEHEFLVDEHDNAGGTEQDRPMLQVEPGWILTPAALSLLGRKSASPVESEDFIAVLYVEKATALDGVYWGDRYEAEALSCPHATIVPARLAAWAVSSHPDQPAMRSSERFRA